MTTRISERDSMRSVSLTLGFFRVKVSMSVEEMLSADHARLAVGELRLHHLENDAHPLCSPSKIDGRRVSRKRSGTLPISESLLLEQGGDISCVPSSNRFGDRLPPRCLLFAAVTGRGNCWVGSGYGTVVINANARKRSGEQR